MNARKWLVWTGSFLILGLGLAFSADTPQRATGNSFKTTVKSDFQPGPFFVDEDGDGICDHQRKLGNPGFADGERPEWAQRKEGSNYQNQDQNNGASDQFQNRFSQREENRWNRQTARQSRASFGTGECDGTGPNGNISRKGNGQK
jgi:hypothetical protein